MHSYLRAIGFSQINKKQLDELIYEATRRPDAHEVSVDSEGNEFVELSMEVCRGVGVSLRGIYDENDEFCMDYYFPYCKGDISSTNSELEIVRQSDRESYQGVADEARLGVNLIFYLQNAIEYLQKGRKGILSDREYRTFLTGLSLEGKILMPIAQPVLNRTNKKSEDRANLVAAAREGDEEAIESLTLDDMDTYSMISRRITSEDLYSIVSTSFMPYGIESDKYYIVADILEFHKMVNCVTMEELYQMHLRSNDLEFSICMNAKDLLGEPEVGRRFKGSIWLQGAVEF